MPTRRASFRLPGVLTSDVQEVATRNGETLTDAVVWGMHAYLERESWRERALRAEAELKAIKEGQ